MLGRAGRPPRHGFLSERADFARACAEAGLVFVGPPPQATERLGDKVAAKLLAAEVGVPTLPGIERPGLETEDPAVDPAELTGAVPVCTGTLWASWPTTACCSPRAR